MSDNGSRVKLNRMPKEECLIYNSRTGQSNLIEWNKKMCLFMEAVFGAKASPIFRERLLPRCMRSHVYVESPGLPDESDQSAVANKARELDYSEWRQERREFITSQAQMVSTYLTGTLSQSSLDRIKDTRETDMEAAIRASDILEVHKIVWDCHQYRGKTFKVADQQRVLREFTMFNYTDGESLPSLKRRLMELLERMKNYDVSPTAFQIMYAFLMCAARFSNNHVQDICIDYLSLVDDDTRFPLDLNSVYEELITKADVVSQVASRNRVRQHHEGSVHQTALRENIRSQVDRRAKGNNNSNKGVRPKGQVNSAYSNINKSVKKKLESHTMAGKPKNVHTDAQSREWQAKNPGKTHRDYLNQLDPCNICGHRWHLPADCRKGKGPRPNNAKAGHSNNSGQKKTFRKKFVKNGRVNNVVGKTPGFFEDDTGDDWIGCVFCAVASPMSVVNFDVECIDDYDLDSVVTFHCDEKSSFADIDIGPVPIWTGVERSNVPVSSFEAELISTFEAECSLVKSFYFESSVEVPVEDAEFNQEYDKWLDVKVEAERTVVFGSDEEIDAYLDSLEVRPVSSDLTYEEVSEELDRLLNECTYLYSDPGDQWSEVSEAMESVVDNISVNSGSMPELISNSDSSSENGSEMQEANEPDPGDGDGSGDESSESDNTSSSDEESVDSNVPNPVIVPRVFELIDSSTIPVYELTYDLRHLHETEYFTGREPRLAEGVRVDEEINGWIEMIMYLTGRAPVKSFYFDDDLVKELSRLPDITSSSQYRDLYIDTNCWFQSCRVYVGLNVFKFIYNMYSMGLNRVNVVKEMCENIEFRSRLHQGETRVQLWIDELDTEWKSIDETLNDRIQVVQGYLDTTLTSPRSVPGTVWEYTMFRQRANLLVQRFNLHPQRTMENWHATLCNLVSGALQMIDYLEFKKTSHRCIVTFGAIVHLARHSGQDNKTMYGICKQKVVTMNGISHVIGTMYVIRDALNRSRRDCKVVRDQRKGITLSGVHAVTISREQDNQDGNVDDQPNVVILELSDDALTVPNVGRYPHISMSDIAKEDWDQVPIDDETRVSFYRSEMVGVPRGVLANVYTQYKADILIACHQFYITYVAEIDERRPCDLDTFEGTDTRDEWFILQALVHRSNGSNGSVAFRQLREIGVPDLIDVIEYDVEGVPGRNRAIHQKGNGKETSLPGFVRFMCMIDSEGNPHWYYVQRVKGIISVKSEPRIYYTMFHDAVSHHCLVHHQHFNETLSMPLDAQVFMANNIQPHHSNKRTKMELLRDLEYLDIPDAEAPRNLLVAGTMYMRYDPSEPIYLFDRLFIYPRDAQQWRQIKIALNYDRSRRGIRNELRVFEELRDCLRGYLYDFRNIQNTFNIYIRYDLPEDHQPFRFFSAGVTDHIYVHGPEEVSFVRDHVRHGVERRDFYYRQLPNLIVRVLGGYTHSADMMYEYIHHRIDQHENAVMNSFLSYREYLLRYGRTIIENTGMPPVELSGPAMEYDPMYIHPMMNQEDVEHPSLDDINIDLRADAIAAGADREWRQIPGVLRAASDAPNDDDDPDQPPAPGSAVFARTRAPSATLESIEECLDDYFKDIPDPNLILSPTLPGAHPFDATDSETASERITKWLESPEMITWKEQKMKGYDIPGAYFNVQLRSNTSEDLNPAQSAALMARDSRSARVESKYDNHTCIVIDTMANVNVFRNSDLVPEVKRVNQGMNIEGVGEIGTRTQSRGVHPLFGEVWILPSNTYNILSQYQAKLNGFLMQFSDDNETCWLVNKAKNVSLFFERDPADHFLKCTVQVDSTGPKVFSYTAIQNKSAVYLIDKQSMYYTQEQLRKAEIVEAMHVALEHPSDQQLTALIMSPSSLNMPVTVQDLHNLRAIKGPCNVCLEGKPQPHVGSHSTKDLESEATQPGEELHCDIVFVQRLPRLFTVCHVTGYMTFTLMTSKFAHDVLEAFDTVINAYKSYLKVVRYVSCDNESVLKSIESELNKRGVRMRIRLPYEHEKRAERAMRVVRERMRVKIRELPYKLPKKLYDALAAECIRNINLMPNYKSLPHSPVELVKGDKVNYLTDISPSFGSLVLCPTYGEKQKAGSETKQEIAIALGPTGSNMKGGVLVYIPGREKPVVRRNVKSLAMTESMINHMNKWAESLPGFEDAEFVFRDTIASEASRGEDFNQDVDLSDVVASSPDNTQFNQLIEQEYVDGGVSGETYESSLEPPVMSPTVADLSPTLVDISYRIDPIEVNNNNNNSSVPMPVTYKDAVASSPTKKNPAAEHVRRKYGREQHIDPSAIIGSTEKRSTRSKGETPKVYQMSLKKAIASAAGDAAIEAAKRELKQLVDLKTWVYVKSRADASPSVHTRVTPCSMFLKEKFNSRGEFLLWKARLVDGGHRTDPTKYDPFEKSSPTTSLEIVYILLSMAVTENMEIESFDVPGAYLNAALQPGRFHLMSIDKSIAKLLMQVDPRSREFVQPDGSILVEIRRSLYGLPEASKLWYDYFTKALTVGGYKICPHDPCLFIRRRQSELSVIALYVDDCLHVWRGGNVYRELYNALRNAKLPDLKVDKLEGTKSISFLGLNITRNHRDRTLSVNQLGYINNLLETDGGYKSFPATPCTDQLFKITDVVENENVEPTESTPFASLLMKTRYCERTRPDLCLPLAVLQTKMRNPNENDENLLHRCIAYLEGTRDRSMIIRRCDMKVFAYMDAGFAVHGNRVSHSGIHFTLGKYGNTILCKSIKQKTVATSSTEAELICIFDGLDYLIWIRNVLGYLGYPQGTSTIYQDNTSTITMAYMGRGSSGSRTRHIDIKYFHIKQFLDSKELEIDHLSRDNMTADFFASPRQGTVFRRFRGMIMGEIL